jgi:hypothetical protein
MEGQQGMQAAFDIATGPGPDGVNISGSLFPSTMSPHDTVEWMVRQPGAGTVVAKGDCTVAGGKAAFFESSLTASLFPGITKSSGGYALLIAHGEKMVYLVIVLPENGDSFMPEVKGILGSWQWDQS